ncbi:GST-38 protein [Aphelenchoides avenae]|nr:GST-38 protein [Aphelenchus avenae]
MFGDFISADITPKTVRFFWTLVGSVPKEERPELYETTFLPAVKAFGGPVEKQLKTNGSGFLVGPRVTWVDFLLAAYVEMMMKGDAKAFKGFPLIEEHYKTVCGLKGVREYIEKRPQYDY